MYDSIGITGNPNVDIMLLSTVDSQTLDNLTINHYMKKILDDQRFWSLRL